MIQRYVLKSSENQRMILNQLEFDAVWSALTKKEKFVRIQNTIISLTIPPAVTPIEQWMVNENERLASFNKRICRKCLSVMDAITNTCPCLQEKGIGREQHALIGNNAELEGGLKGIFDWPELTEADKVGVEIEEKGITKFNREIPTQEGPDFYYDEATGEKMYS